MQDIETRLLFNSVVLDNVCCHRHNFAPMTFSGITPMKMLHYMAKRNIADVVDYYSVDCNIEKVSWIIWVHQI